jgi:spore germination protein GerM
MAAKKKPTLKEKKGRTSLGAVFWIFFFLVMAALFLINYPRIQKTWKNVFGKEDRTELEGQADPELTPEAISEAARQAPPPPPPPPPDERAGIVVEEAQPNESAAEEPVEKPAAAARPAAADEAPPDLRERTLYFVSVDSTGMVFIKSVKRMVATRGSPLLESLNALLSGPNPQEKAQGLSSLIPEGSRILSARVDGGTAFLNFNETFMFNGYGAEGYVAQLRQIVWTASEFSSVRDVQALIEGKKISFLGETIRIDRPIARDTL